MTNPSVNKEDLIKGEFIALVSGTMDNNSPILLGSSMNYFLLRTYSDYCLSDITDTHSAEAFRTQDLDDNRI